MPAIQRLTTADPAFWKRLEMLTAWEGVADEAVTTTVRDILAQVRTVGDVALLEYTRRFDRLNAEQAGDLEIPPDRLQEALAALPSAQQRRAETPLRPASAPMPSARNLNPGRFTEADGTVLGQQVTPLGSGWAVRPRWQSGLSLVGADERHSGQGRRRAGNRHGRARRPAGNSMNLVLAAAAVAGVNRVFTIGGAQASRGAGLRHGHRAAQVDKIVGPGNAYVAAAKRQVFGTVGIDMIAGPSEILVVCDGQTDPDWIAMDLYSRRPNTMRTPSRS
jgi:histidinol dehydrogenase